MPAFLPAFSNRRIPSTRAIYSRRTMQCKAPHRALTTILTALTLTFPAAAQTSRSISDGVYTLQQANRGKSIYSEQCANCHGAQLNGGDETPPLIGDRFLAT